MPYDTIVAGGSAGYCTVPHFRGESVFFPVFPQGLQAVGELNLTVSPSTYVVTAIATWSCPKDWRSRRL